MLPIFLEIKKNQSMFMYSTEKRMGEYEHIKILCVIAYLGGLQLERGGGSIQLCLYELLYGSIMCMN